MAGAIGCLTLRNVVAGRYEVVGVRDNAEIMRNVVEEYAVKRAGRRPKKNDMY